MTLFEQINNDIQVAMKARDSVRLESLRGIKKVMLEAKSAIGANAELSDEESLKIISKLAKQGSESAAIYKAQNRDDLAEAELAQVAIFEEYLPAMLGADEIESIIKEIINSTGAQGMKDMGKVMGMATKQMAGRADGKLISDKVRSLLQ
jgi:uncharacterized protein